MHIITVVKYLAFCETNARRYEEGDDNLLGFVQYYPILSPQCKENVRRFITEKRQLCWPSHPKRSNLIEDVREEGRGSL
jgi:hypothetical protein